MKAFYILKPDMIDRTEVIEYYNKMIDGLSYVGNRRQYLIESWVELSCKLYEPNDSNLSLDELKRIRGQLLTTIKGYDYLFNGRHALIDMFDIPNDIEILRELEKIKYHIRKEYVMRTSKNYFKFTDDIDSLLCGKLKDVPVSSLDVSHIRLNYDEDLEETEYRLAFLNCIHFPDPDEVSILRDIGIIDDAKVLTRKIKI